MIDYVLQSIGNDMESCHKHPQATKEDSLYSFLDIQGKILSQFSIRDEMFSQKLKNLAGIIIPDRSSIDRRSIQIRDHTFFMRATAPYDAFSSRFNSTLIFFHPSSFASKGPEKVERLLSSVLDSETRRTLWTFQSRLQEFHSHSSKHILSLFLFFLRF